MTIDSNIIIAYLAGDSKIVKALQTWFSEGRQLFLAWFFPQTYSNRIRLEGRFFVGQKMTRNGPKSSGNKESTVL